MANKKRQARRAAERKTQQAYRRGQVRQQRRISKESVDRGRSAANRFTPSPPPVKTLTEEEVNPGYNYDKDADYAEVTIEYCQGCFQDGDVINVEDPFDAERGINLFINDDLIRGKHRCTGTVDPRLKGIWKKIVWKLPPELHEKLLQNVNIEPGPRVLDIRMWKD